ncbi:uncharacterized protein LOC141653338 [Silene latifolia]|uniref:uncharacterized protein LOC141653338 n=1 Tax=Silene latifolia TaxID=37657 RepID=UPI003D77C8DB
MQLKVEVTKMGRDMICKGDTIGDLTVEPEFYNNLIQTQFLDPKIQEWREIIGNRNMLRFSLYKDRSVRYDGRWCVPGDAETRKAIMTEAHCTPYSVHPGGDKLYVTDPSHVLEVEHIELDEALTYVETPKEILDRKVRKTRKGETVLLKVLSSNHKVEEATWEAEETMKKRYPYLFD